MAGNARRIVVEFIGEDRSLSRTASKVEGTTGKLAGRLRKVGLIAGGVLATGALAAAKGLYEAGQAAIEDQAAAARLAQTLKNTTGATNAHVASVEKWITAQGKALGVTDDELRPALARLVTATRDVGEAQKLASLAMDVSAGTGKSLEAVSTALAKAQNGNVGALGRLGIATKDASGKTLEFDQLQQNLAKTFEGQASTSANTLQGRIRRLRVRFDEAKESIGTALLPVAEKFTDWLVDEAIPNAQSFADTLNKEVKPALKGQSDSLKKSTKDGERWADKYRSISESFSSIIDSMRKAWDVFGSDIRKSAKIHFSSVLNITDSFLKTLAGLFKFFTSAVTGDWKGAWAGLKQAASSGSKFVTETVMLTMVNPLRAIFSALGTALKSSFGQTWNGLKQKAAEGVESIRSAIANLPDKIRSLGGKMKSAGAYILEKLLNGIAVSGGFASSFASKLWEACRRAINKGIDKFNRAVEISVKLPKVLGGGSISIDPPDVPHLYRGGVVKGSRDGMLAVIGDRGHDEAVVPLSGPHAPAGLGGGITINISGALDPVAVGKQVEQVLVKYRRSTGRALEFV